ncbi:hypothetical protein MEO41_25970, partial [Dolichospermum sp. ST_sed4]|nr:hypothetical protein [Dolichospermum sp. ST_sed4]
MFTKIPKTYFYIATAMLLAIVVLISLTIQSRAAFAMKISYQGKLTDNSTGNPVADSKYDFIARLYDASSGGNLKWTETRTSAVMFDQALTSKVTPGSCGGSNYQLNYSLNTNEASLRASQTLWNATQKLNLPIISVNTTSGTG